MAHLIQTANGQLMLQTINSPGPAGQIQVASSQHPHLQQIQVLPISSLQGGGNQIVLQSSGATAAPQQAAQIIQTSDGQTLLYPIQIDSQGNITQHQPQPGSIIQLTTTPQQHQQTIQAPPTANSPTHLTASPAPNNSHATPPHHTTTTVGGVVTHHQQQQQHATLPTNVVMVNNTSGSAVATTSVPQIQRVPITGAAQVLEEEPLYVNAKQYHRIVKRREARAKLENDGRIPKERRKYLHESRHRHAMNRVRGEGGRFDKGNSPYANTRRGGTNPDGSVGSGFLGHDVTASANHELKIGVPGRVAKQILTLPVVAGMNNRSALENKKGRKPKPRPTVTGTIVGSKLAESAAKKPEPAVCIVNPLPSFLPASSITPQSLWSTTDPLSLISAVQYQRVITDPSGNIRCHYTVESVAAPKAPNVEASLTPLQPLVAQPSPELMSQQQQQQQVLQAPYVLQAPLSCKQEGYQFLQGEPYVVGSVQPQPLDLEAFLQQCGHGGRKVMQTIHQHEKSPLFACTDAAASTLAAVSETVTGVTHSQSGGEESSENIVPRDACNNRSIHMIVDEIDAAIGCVDGYREQYREQNEQAREEELEQQTYQEKELANWQQDQLKEEAKLSHQQCEARQQLSLSSSSCERIPAEEEQEKTLTKKRRQSDPASAMKKRRIT